MKESVGSLVDEAESVLVVQPLGDLIKVGDFQHDRHGRLVGASLHFEHECVADATVRFIRDVGQHPRPCRGVVDAVSANLTFVALLASKSRTLT